MREQLNNNPVAQIALVGPGRRLLSPSRAAAAKKRNRRRPKRRSPSPAPKPAAQRPARRRARRLKLTKVLEAAPTEATASSAVPVAAGAIETPPLPADVRAAYGAGKTVVLLVVDNGGIDDRLVKQAAAQLGSLEKVAVIIVPAEKIARYAAITLGVEVERVPALVAVRPKGLSGRTPQASVSYGFQSPQSVVQAVKDAGYRGPTVDYHP